MGLMNKAQHHTGELMVHKISRLDLQKDNSET